MINICLSVLLIPEVFTAHFPSFFTFIKEQCGKAERIFLFGIFALGVGVFKLLSPVYGDVPVFGDILPALANLGGGGILLLENLEGAQNKEIPFIRILHTILVDRKHLWGYGCLIAGILHFFLPTMIFF
ncbi:MAG: hypothetical protein N2442_10215 [Spirochaetes bacterium]|nr:hypothetical protein [Spirochaetota bacterium]